MPVPPVVLLDLKLSRVSGLDVLKRIRAEARPRRLPVVILSSSTEERDLIDGYDLGANGYVRKPLGLRRTCHRNRAARCLLVDHYRTGPAR
jgi:DNA-binding response OmpR family regulator